MSHDSAIVLAKKQLEILEMRYGVTIKEPVCKINEGDLKLLAQAVISLSEEVERLNIVIRENNSLQEGLMLNERSIGRMEGADELTRLREAVREAQPLIEEHESGGGYPGSGETIEECRQWLEKYGEKPRYVRQKMLGEKNEKKRKRDIIKSKWLSE